MRKTIHISALIVVFVGLLTLPIAPSFAEENNIQMTPSLEQEKMSISAPALSFSELKTRVERIVEKFETQLQAARNKIQKLAEPAFKGNEKSVLDQSFTKANILLKIDEHLKEITTLKKEIQGATSKYALKIPTKKIQQHVKSVKEEVKTYLKKRQQYRAENKSRAY